MSYAFRVLLGFDQLLTTILGGWPDESLSSYAWRLEKAGKRGGKIFRPVIDWIFGLWGDSDHCRKAYESERLRLQVPPELR